jgi:hypothetical protein
MRANRRIRIPSDSTASSCRGSEREAKTTPFVLFGFAVAMRLHGSLPRGTRSPAPGEDGASRGFQLGPLAATRPHQSAIPAVHHQGSAGHERRVVGREEEHGSGDLLGRADAAERNRREDDHELADGLATFVGDRISGLRVRARSLDEDYELYPA